MAFFICKTCGVEFAESAAPPDRCPICEDERQFIGWQGQQWTTMDELRTAGYRNEIREEEANLLSISVVPALGIAQRAFLVRTAAGNVLYDCVPYLDDGTVAAIRGMGGISALTFSHPHFYASMATWSQAFDGAPIYIPDADAEWVMRPDSAVRPWDGAPLELVPGVTLIQCGGHFPGSAVLHWDAGGDGDGVLLTGDTIRVVMDRRYVSFMWSYPNIVPLPARDVSGIVEALQPYDFDRLYGGWWGHVIPQGAKGAVTASAARYARFVGGGSAVLEERGAAPASASPALDRAERDGG